MLLGLEVHKSLGGHSGAKQPTVAKATWGTGVEDESGDQDPSIKNGGEEYARAYSAIQARKSAAANSAKATKVYLHPTPSCQMAFMKVKQIR